MSTALTTRKTPPHDPPRAARALARSSSPVAVICICRPPRGASTRSLMIHGVRFRNFKALRNVELALERFTVLVGPNASGKTAVLEGLHHLTRLATNDP